MTPMLHRVGERLQRLRTAASSLCDHQRSRPLRTCWRMPSNPALSASASTRCHRFENPLQDNCPTFFSRMRHPHDPTIRQNPLRVSLKANLRSSDDPSIYIFRINLTRPLPRTSLASATHVVSANRITCSPRSPREGESGNTTPCRMTGVTLHSQVHYKEVQARTCSGPLFSSAKPYLHTMSMYVSSARAGPVRQNTVEHDPFIKSQLASQNQI